MCATVLTVVAYMSKRIYGGNGSLPNGVVPCTRDVGNTVQSISDGNSQIGKRAKPDRVDQSWITHYLFGNNGIISILLPYLVFNSTRYPNYGANLLATCSFVSKCGGGKLRIHTFGAAMRSFWRMDATMHKYAMLMHLRWYTCGMKSCLDNNPNLLERWPDLHFEGETTRFDKAEAVLRGVHLRSENMQAHSGLYIAPVLLLDEGVYCVTWNPRYHRWFSVRPVVHATRHKMASAACHRPELFDCDVDSRKFSNVWNIEWPRLVRRDDWTGCKDEKCGVCVPKGGKGWVYVGGD